MTKAAGNPNAPAARQMLRFLRQHPYRWYEAAELGAESLLACAAKHRTLPVDAFVAALARELFGQANPADDLTLLGMQVLAPA